MLTAALTRDETEEDRHVRAAAGTGDVLPQAQGPWSPQTPERPGRILPQATGGSRACSHLGFELLASGTVKKLIYVVLSHQVYCKLFRQDLEINTGLEDCVWVSVSLSLNLIVYKNNVSKLFLQIQFPRGPFHCLHFLLFLESVLEN